MKARVDTPRLAFLGRFGTGNLGNECTLSALLGAARRCLPGAQLEAICHAPEVVSRLHGIPAVPVGFPRATAEGRTLPRPLRVPRRAARELFDAAQALGVMRRHDALVVAGTGCVTDADDGPLGFPWHLFKWCHAARLLGKSVVFMGVGVEGIHTRLGKKLLFTALRSATYRSFRDRQSQKRLVQLGFEMAGDVVAPDVAFCLPRPEPVARRRQGKRAVGVGLYGANGDAEPVPGYAATMAELVEWLLERGHPVRLLIGDAVYDADAQRRVVAELDRRGVDRARYAAEPAQSFEEVLTQLGQVDLLVASRFHNLALHLLLGKPAVSISYDPKNEALLEDVGLGSFCQTLEGLDLARLKEQLTALDENAVRLCQSVQGRVQRYREQLEAQHAQVFGEIALQSAARR